MTPIITAALAGHALASTIPAIIAAAPDTLLTPTAPTIALAANLLLNLL